MLTTYENTKMSNTVLLLLHELLLVSFVASALGFALVTSLL